MIVLDTEVYLPLSNWGRSGYAFNETSKESWSKAALVRDLVEDQLTNVERVIGFHLPTQRCWDATDEIRDLVRDEWHRTQHHYPESVTPKFLENYDDLGAFSDDLHIHANNP